MIAVVALLSACIIVALIAHRRQWSQMALIVAFAVVGSIVLAVYDAVSGSTALLMPSLMRVGGTAAIGLGLLMSLM